MKKIILFDAILYLICLISIFVFMSYNYLDWTNLIRTTMIFLVGLIFIYYHKIILGYSISLAPVVGYYFEYFANVDHGSKAAIIGTKAMMITVVIGVVVECIHSLVKKLNKGL